MGNLRNGALRRTEAYTKMAHTRRVLITGAAGYIGTFLTRAWRDRYDLVLVDVKEPREVPEDAQVVVADVQDVEKLREACRGVDTVVHLAADASPSADFDASVLPKNVIGTHNVYRAASEAGVKRVIFASSIHCVGGYPSDVQVKWDMPVRPCCEYGASKCYGEAVGRYFSDKKGLSVIAVRIGGVHGHEGNKPHHQPQRVDIGVSEQDLTQLMTLCVEAPEDMRYEIIHALSDNRFKRLDISHTREVLGYEPTDEAGEEMDIPEPAPVHP